MMAGFAPSCFVESFCSAPEAEVFTLEIGGSGLELE